MVRGFGLESVAAPVHIWYIPSTGYPGKSVSADDSVFDEQDHQNQVQSDEMKMEQILEEEATRKRILKYRRLSINS